MGHAGGDGRGVRRGPAVGSCAVLGVDDLAGRLEIQSSPCCVTQVNGFYVRLPLKQR